LYPHTPPRGHPSQEGNQGDREASARGRAVHPQAGAGVTASSPLERRGAKRRGVFDRKSLALTPPAYAADIPATRFADTIRGDSPDGCAIALLGLADDTGVKLNHGREGAAQGPGAFRAALARYGAAEPAAPAAGWPRVFDAGDVPPGATLDETHARVTAATRALLDAGLFPIAIGGGHDLTFPFVRALAQKLGPAAPLTGVYFDAHLDVRETAGSGMAFRSLIDGGHARTLHLHGFRPLVNSRAHHAWFVAHGGHAHVDSPNGDFHLIGESRAETKNLFVSFDLDVVDAAHAPGVSAPNPCGWTPREAERAVLAAGADPRVRCFDLMELCPPHDEGGRTARFAAHLFLTFLAGFALRGNGA
jgi:formiminoglutamase